MDGPELFSEAPARRGRPRSGRTEPATLVVLSPSTEVVLSRRGATFIRGREAFELSDRELAALTSVLTETEPRG